MKRALVSDDQLTGVDQLCVLIDGTVRKTPEAHIDVSTPFFTGPLKALCMRNPVYDLIIGNIEGVRGPDDPDPEWDKKTTEVKNLEQKIVQRSNKNSSSVSEELVHDSTEESALTVTVNGNSKVTDKSKDEVTDVVGAVETRAQKQRKSEKIRPLRTASVPIENVTPERLKQAQKEDSTLKNCLSQIGIKRPLKGKQGTTEFLLKKEILYRRVSENEKVKDQLVVPNAYREQVMRLGHDSIMSGHLGISKTSDKVLSQFYWPGVTADIYRYCKSCDVCQRTCDKGRVTKVPLGRMPLIDTPFKRVAVDIVGPISPVSRNGNRYILTLVDYATRFPEAVPYPALRQKGLLKPW